MILLHSRKCGIVQQFLIHLNWKHWVFEFFPSLKMAKNIYILSWNKLKFELLIVLVWMKSLNIPKNLPEAVN